MSYSAEGQRPSPEKMTASPPTIGSALRSPLSVVLLGFIALGIVARIFGLSLNGYWLDELASVTYFANPAVPFGKLLSDVLPIDNSPPLYYLFLYFWSSLFGQSEAATRSLSVIFGVAAIFSPFILRRPAAPLRRKLLLSALIACSYAAVYYSQEARSYSLLILLSALATFTFVNIDTALVRSRELGTSDLVRLSVLSILLAYTHYFGFLLFCSLYAILGVRALWVRNVSAFWKLVLHGVVIVMLFVPWVLLVLYKREDLASPFNADFLFVAKHVAVYGSWLTGSILGATVCGLLIAAYVGFTFAYFLRMRQRPAAREVRLITSRYSVPIAIFAIVFVLSLIVSAALASIVSYRNFLVTLPAFFLYVAYSLEFFSKLFPIVRRNFALVVAALASVLLFGSLYDHYQPHKEHWRQSAAYIESIDGCSTAEIAALGQMERWKGYYEFYLRAPGIRITPLIHDNSGYVFTEGARETVRRILEQPCPVKIWAGHIAEDKLMTILDGLGVPPDVIIKQFPKVFVVERRAQSS